MLGMIMAFKNIFKVRVTFTIHFKPYATGVEHRLMR